MKAINAITVPGGAATWDLPHHTSKGYDRSGAKRLERRRQRKALRAELPSLVESSLDADAAAAQDVAAEVAAENLAMATLSFAKQKLKKLTVAKPTLHLLADVEPQPKRTVTVIRKQANRRRVVESLQVYAYPLAA